MIPKVIHYCWFGRGPKNEMINKCINSWKKNLKDYEIIEWNEDNFDLNSNDYVREAYENKKWAFVTDYVRLYAIYNYGGIYMDTDVEVLKSINTFLNLKGFTGFEHETGAITGIIASEKDNMVIKELLNYYDNRHFCVNGKMDLTTNVETVTNIFVKKYNLQLNNETQVIGNDDFIIYSKEYFCPKEYDNGKINLTKNTYTIHHFNGSWITTSEKLTHKIRYYLKKFLGESLFKIIVFPYHIIRNIHKSK